MPITDPTDIAGLHHWFDGDTSADFTITGSGVSTWNDRSGNGHHLQQTTDADRPQRDASWNGRTGVRFAGTFKMISDNFATISQPVTVAYYARVASGGDYTLFDRHPSGSSRHGVSRWAEGTYRVYAGADISMGALDGVSPHVVTIRYNGASSIFRFDGVDTASPFDPQGGGLSGLTLGGANTGGLELLGEVYEFFAYEALLTTGEIADVEAYLSARWVPLPPAVAFEALGVKAGTGTTTVSVAHPAGTANHQVLLAGRCAWESGATFSNETGWTASGSLQGGTGTATDAHITVIRVDRKEITGADAGPTVFDQATAGQGGVAAVMASYEKVSTTATWAFATATGDDATHAANRSVTSSTNLDLSVGDVVTAWVAVDTDAAMTITSPAITATDVTFGTTTRRTSGVGSGTGDDGNIELFDATVTALSSGTELNRAVTLAFTTATTQCGPVAFVRVRAVSPNVNGTAAGSLAITGAASGAPEPPGAGTGTGQLVIVGAAAGVRDTTGVVVGSLAITATAVVPSGEGAVATHLVTGTLGFSGGGQAWSAATAAFSVTAGDVLVVFAGACDSNVAQTSGYLTCAAAGYTFTPAALAYDTGAFTSDAEAWTAVVPSTNASQTVTLGTGLAEAFQLDYSIWTVSGVDTTDPVGAIAGLASAAADGALTLTLDAAPAADSEVLAFVFVTSDSGADKGVAAGVGWTAGGSYLPAVEEGYCQTQHRTGSTSTSVAWLDIDTSAAITTYHSAALAVEIKAGAAAADVTGAAVGALALSGVATGVRDTAGTAVGSLTLTGTGVGLGAPLGVAAGSLTLTATAVGTVAHTATAAGSLTVTGSIVIAQFVGRRPAEISGRKVLDQEGDVHLMRTFSSWAMANNLSLAEITSALEALAGRGFNGVTVHMGGSLDYGSGWHRYTDDAGQNFWTGTPWASDLGPAWNTVDHLIAEAGRLGITVHFSFCGGFDDDGCRADWIAVTNADMEQVGIDIATRYLDVENIVWHVMFDGGDQPDHPSGLRIQALFEGINDTEGISTRPVRWVETTLGNDAGAWLGTTSFNVTINCWYSYDMNSAEIAEVTWADLPVPTGDSEPPYDGSNHFTGNVGQQLRERSYCTFLEGGILINYGHEDWYRFGAFGPMTEGFEWFEVPDDPHTIQQQYCWELLDAYVADATFAPSAWVTTGTGSGDTKAGAGNSDTAALAYFPSSRTIAVDTTVIAGTGSVTLRWFDPTNNTFTVIVGAEAQQTGRSVTHPGNNSDGQGDWLLVVTTAPLGAATGSVAFVAAATGQRQTPGTAAGSLTIAGTVTGVIAESGIAAGAVAFSATASGVRETSGVATGALSFTATAVGLRPMTGAAGGSLAVTATAAGVRGTSATATGALSFTATAIGQVVGEAVGFAAGSLAVNAVALGIRETAATAAGSLELVAIASGVGVAPTTAAATGTLAIEAVAVGVPDVSAVAVGSVSFTATAVGQTAGAPVGFGSATLLIEGSAVGEVVTPDLGAAVGTIVLLATAVGQRDVFGSAHGALAIIGRIGAEAVGLSADVVFVVRERPRYFIVRE